MNLNRSIPDDGVPLSVVLDLPVWIKRADKSTAVPLPVLITIQDGEPVVPPEALEFAIERAAVEKFGELRRMMVTIARVYDSWRASYTPLVTARDVDTAIWNYLYMRLTPPKAVSWEVVRSEFRYILKFVKSCRRNPKNRSIFSQALSQDSTIYDEAMPIRRSRGFLQHLEIQRRRWLEMQDYQPDLPSDLKKIASPATRKVVKLVQFPTSEQMDSIIDCERNPMFKAAWCALAGQGPRFSELLHMFRCDVLPASYAARFGGCNDGHPFLIYAHPELSKYTGSPSAQKDGEDRSQFLTRKFSEVSRLNAVQPNERLGWKRMLLFDGRLLSWGYWMVDRYAREFERLLPLIWSRHQELNTDAHHPYFFINYANSEHRGKPMKMQNLQRAYSAACRRVGLEPFIEHGGHVHGMRHYYKWHATEIIGLSEEEVQIVMRHGSVSSQKDYGRRVAELNAKFTMQGG